MSVSKSSDLHRDIFMSVWRNSTDLNETLTTDDRIEIFMEILRGSSDLTPELLNKLLANYNVTDIKVIPVNDQEPVKTFMVHGSYGDIIVNAETGRVIGVHLFNPDTQDELDKAGCEEYKMILAFNLEEWKQYHNKQQLDAHVDILDLGTWYYDPEYPYEEPAYKWRKDRELARKDEL